MTVSCIARRLRRRVESALAIIAVFISVVVGSSTANADWVLELPDGRKVLLKENGTWAFVPQTESKVMSGDIQGHIEVELVDAVSDSGISGATCRIRVQIINRTNSKIQNIAMSRLFAFYDNDGDRLSPKYGDHVYAIFADPLTPGEKAVQERGFTVNRSCSVISRVEFRPSYGADLDSSYVTCEDKNATPLPQCREMFSSNLGKVWLVKELSNKRRKKVEF